MTIFICILHQGKLNDGRLPRLFLEAGRYYDLLQDDVADVLAGGGDCSSAGKFMIKLSACNRLTAGIPVYINLQATP